ncbi:ADP-ribosylglycohydrolase family protein [Chamaesiphon sp.]|uniref:ADP-ribosylglycohydrolase family protein n=1 Tax=Chamaesiphon sp. TaxID=2814140 RepID=UPI00359406F8
MQPLTRAELALTGLSIGDAFGQMFFGNTENMSMAIDLQALPAPPWYLTDDSIMAIGIVETLREWGEIDRDYLASRFANNYRRNPRRGYGGMAHHILREFCKGEDWRVVAPAVFDGMGSYGNGAAMRVAPVGGFYAEDLAQLQIQAVASAEVTHSHLEGKVGALAIALAAAWAWNHRDATHSQPQELFTYLLGLLPDSDTKSGIKRASELPLECSVTTAVSVLGNGTMVSAPDTVPFTIWCAVRHLHDFEAAMWATVSGLGDRDTTCAIVGGIVALSVGDAGIPQEWLQARESLTEWESAQVSWDID